ncbi:hypothetical protein C8Q74DRAFT_253746 [Fomes fomentarius]|nr:hypothetical protein C8Q74DRAFT_253746 [Fomes fomentarius]
MSGHPRMTMSKTWESERNTELRCVYVLSSCQCTSPRVCAVSNHTAGSIFGGRAPNCTAHFAHEKFENYEGGQFTLTLDWPPELIGRRE